MWSFCLCHPLNTDLMFQSATIFQSLPWNGSFSGCLSHMLHVCYYQFSLYFPTSVNHKNFLKYFKTFQIFCIPTDAKTPLQFQLCLLRKILINIYLLSLFAYLLSLFAVVTLFPHHQHIVLSRPPLQCRARSAKHFHTKQLKIFCFLYCRPTAL